MVRDGVTVLVVTHEERVSAAADAGAPPRGREAAVRLRSLVHLAALNLRSDRRGTVVNAAAACVGAAALVFFVALGMGVGQAARLMFPGDARLVEVVPGAVSLGAALGRRRARRRGGGAAARASRRGGGLAPAHACGCPSPPAGRPRACG